HGRRRDVARCGGQVARPRSIASARKRSAFVSPQRHLRRHRDRLPRLRRVRLHRDEVGGRRYDPRAPAPEISPRNAGAATAQRQAGCRAPPRGSCAERGRGRDVRPFDKPIYVTRSNLPPLADFARGLEEIWDSHRLSNRGLVLQRLENKLAHIFETPNVSLFTNGTLALQVGLQGLRLSGEVVTTPFTFAATANTLIKAG